MGPGAMHRAVVSDLCWLFCLVSPACAAEPKPAEPDFTEMSLEDLGSIKVPTVVGASKHEQKTTEAPSAVSIVTQDDIQKFGYRTVTDVLRSVRGLYASSDQIYNYIGLRGVNRPGDYGGRTLVTVNGHRMNDPLYDQAFNGQELPLDVDLIERVEVIRGPGSSLYGNNAFFGVINIVTRDGKGMNGVEASGAAASFDTYNGRLSYGKQFTNGLNLVLSGSALESSGRDDLRYPEFAAINGGRSSGLDGERARKFFVSASWQDFTLEGVYGKRHRDVPNAAYGTQFGLAPNYADDERAYLELRYQHEFPKDWLLTARVFFDHYLFEGEGPYASAPPGGPPVVNFDSGKAQYLGGEFQVGKTFFDDHRLTAGTEWRTTTTLRQFNHDISPYQVISDVRGSVRDFGFYLQDEYQVSRQLTINAGLRYDWFSSVGGTVNPRGALIYNPWKETTLKLLYGQAFRAPNGYEFDYVAPGYGANHALAPEKIRSYELVWEQGFARHYRASGSLFLNQMKGLITQQEVPDRANPGQTLFVFQNTDSVETRGAELELEAAAPGGWRARASYSFVEAYDPVTRTRLVNSHKHLGKFNLVAPLYAGKIFAGLEVQAGSARKTLLGDDASGFAVCNLTLYSRELVRGLEVSASVYNLFDTRFADPVSADLAPLDTVRQDGRTFRVKLTYKF